MSQKSTPLGYWTAAVAIIGGFLQSYITCVIAGALLFISREFELSAVQEGWAASIILLGALFGSMIAGSLADRWGRRISLQIAALLFFVSGLGAFFIGGFSSLLAVRLLAGLAAGMASILVPLYLGEIAPAAQRGAFVTAFTVAVTFGTLIAYLVNYSLASTENWRLMFALSAIPAGLQGIALFFFPKSPKWLFVQGRKKEGKRTLYKLQGEVSHNPLLENYELHSKWRDLLRPSVRFVLFLGIALSIFQQLSGINAVIYFTPKIFAEAGFVENRALLSTLLIGIVITLSSTASMFLIDRFGRKRLLLISLAGIILSLGILAFAFATENLYLDYISVPVLIAYVGTYALGMGPIVWVVVAEIYPLFIRAKAIAIMTLLSWLTNYLVVFTFPLLLSKTGSALPFLMFSLLSTGAFFLFLFYLPETKGKTLEELEKMLTTGN